jgi:uncharacterized membrane protein YkvA (DUF1232 family)
LRLAWRLYRDPRVPGLIKGIVPALVALYVFSPIDLIPDVVLGIGQLDDLGVVSLAVLIAIATIKRLAPREVVAEHLATMGQGPVGGSTSSRGTARAGEVIDVTYRVHKSGETRSSGDHGRS